MNKEVLHIFLIRHGQTEGNSRKAYVGREDTSVSDYGRELLLAQPPSPAVSMVISSPMKRCLQTAQILYPEFEPILIDELRERDFGDFEGKTHDEIISLPGYEGWGMTEESMVFPSGEAMEPFLARCVSGFNKGIALMRQAEVEPAAMILHGGVIMALLSQLAHPPKGYYHWYCKNGEGYHILYSPESGVVEDVKKYLS